MNYPQELLRNIYWSFANGEFSSQEDFVSELKAYYKEISDKSLTNIDSIIFKHPKIVLQYLKYNEQEEDYDEPQELLEADNGINFTFIELMFKMHQKIEPALKNEDNCYFEGLTFGTTEDPDYQQIPVYFLDTGS